MVTQHRRVDRVHVKCQRLEQGHRLLTADLLEHHSELVIRKLVHKVTLEPDEDVVASEDGAESEALLAEETEAVTFDDVRFVELGLN